MENKPLPRYTRKHLIADARAAGLLVVENPGTPIQIRRNHSQWQRCPWVALCEDGTIWRGDIRLDLAINATPRHAAHILGLLPNGREAEMALRYARLVLAVPDALLRATAIRDFVRKRLISEGFLHRCPPPNTDCYELTAKGWGSDRLETCALVARVKRWTAAKLDKELGFARGARDDSDPNNLRWLAVIEAEATRRQAIAA